jgi:glycosyltransferase involved in cell wall biosynthesis
LARPLKACIITATYSYTGVALAQVRFARALAERGNEVELIFGRIDVDQLPAGSPGPPVVPGVKVSDWKVDRARGMLAALCRYLRQNKPDAVFCAEDHLNDMVLLAALITRSRAKISCSSRVFPLDQVGHHGPYSTKPFTKQWAFMQLTRRLMKRANAWTCVSEDLARSYRALFNDNRFVWSYNIVVDDISLQRMKEPVDHPWFSDRAVPLVTAAGTLTERKGFPDLIRAIADLRDRGRLVRAAILGEGPMRGELERLIAELRIGDRVWLAGRVENPLKYFAGSPVSALPSYSEGFGNVIVESIMCGCVPVVTDCPVGPRDVLQDGRYGYVVPMHDPAALARGIEAAIDRPISRELLEERLRPFKADAVVDRQLDLLGLR